MKNYLPLTIISLVFVAFRVCAILINGFPVNSAPIAALLVSAYLLNGWKGAGIVSAVWFACYPLLSLLQGYDMGAGLVGSIIGFSLVFGVVVVLKKVSSKSSFKLIGGSVIGAAVFYLVTNSFSWLSMPLYAKNLEGFLQAQWFGHSSFELPTWVFFRNTLLSNLSFALIIWASLKKWNILTSLKAHQATVSLTR